MNDMHFVRYAQIIRNLPDTALEDSAPLDDRLLMDRDDPVRVYYAPLDHFNADARVCIVGLTPGRTQMMNAMREAQRMLLQNADAIETLRSAKRAAAFSGSMRPKLVSLLDAIGVDRWLGLRSCAELFTSAATLVQTTSVLRYPVFVSGQNYSGSPDLFRHSRLRRCFEDYFCEEAQRLSRAVFVPLGDDATRALRYLAQDGRIDENRILDGLPHPSGANGERIAYFLGRKTREALSAKTDSVKLDRARAVLTARIGALR